MKLGLMTFIFIAYIGQAFGQIRPIKPLPDDFNEAQFAEELMLFNRRVAKWKEQFKQDWNNCYEDKLVFSNLSTLKEFLALTNLVPPKLKQYPLSPFAPLNMDPHCGVHDNVEIPNLRCLTKDKDHLKELKEIVSSTIFTTYLADQEKITDAQAAIDIRDFYLNFIEIHKD